MHRRSAKPGLTKLERDIGYAFKERGLLELALTHCSAVPYGEGSHNQRLEFLGDAVLEMCVSEHLYLTHPEMPEGKLTKIRAGIVSEGALAEAARAIHLGAYLRIGKGEECTGGRAKASILADASEALIGAVHLDGGLENARAFILHFLREQIVYAINAGGIRDYKTELQERLHREGVGESEYRIRSETGPDHKKEFLAQVSFAGKLQGEGAGSSKKTAQQEAARAALQSLTAEQNHK